jgi:hypothetical protein
MTETVFAMLARETNSALDELERIGSSAPETVDPACLRLALAERIFLLNILSQIVSAKPPPAAEHEPPEPLPRLN